VDTIKRVQDLMQVREYESMCIGKEMRNIVLHDSNHRPSGRAVKRRDD